MSAIVKFKPLPPPAEWVRKIKSQPKFSDLVEVYTLHLGETDERFHALISTFDNGHAIEGNLKWDDCEAARLVREEAKRSNDKIVGEAKLALIVHALRVVMRRWDISRNQRSGDEPELLENDG